MSDKLFVADVASYLEKRIPELAYAIEELHHEQSATRRRAKPIAANLLRDIRHFLKQPVNDAPTGWYDDLQMVVDELDDTEEYIENAARYSRREEFKEYHRQLLASLGFIRAYALVEASMDHDDIVMESAIKLFIETELSVNEIRLELGCEEDTKESFERSLRRHFERTRGKKLSEVHPRGSGSKKRVNRNK